MTYTKVINELTNIVSYISDNIRLVREHHNDCHRTVYYVFVNNELKGTTWNLKDAKALAKED